ncbi:interleukin-17F-like [Dendropsophus ebraccatus]|uniref:interleukin-17F-like n=1 Tax=Dendropsophus ebraccatus TaxID=150705 RepID=UPI0038321EFD
MTAGSPAYLQTFCSSRRVSPVTALSPGSYVSRDDVWSGNRDKKREGRESRNQSRRSATIYRASDRKGRMVLTRTSLILVTFLVSLCSSTILPDEYLSQTNIQEGSKDEELPLQARVRCPGRRSHHLPSSVTVDTSLIYTSYLDRFVRMRNIHSRSLSPWDYRINKDPNRIPIMIVEANCLTSGCADTDGNENPSLISYPIQQEMIVLQRKEKGCSFSYRLETVTVTVGCTCVKPFDSY